MTTKKCVDCLRGKKLHEVCNEFNMEQHKALRDFFQVNPEFTEEEAGSILGNFKRIVENSRG